jgi:elongation factor P
MIPASDIHTGMVLRMEGKLWRIIEADVHVGGGKIGTMVHVRIRSLETGTETQRRLRSDEKVDNLDTQVQDMTYLYREGENCVFMHQETYEQMLVPAWMLGEFEPFLKDEQSLPVEFEGERPIAVRTPDTVEIKVEVTGPVQHARETSVWKDATLENGMEIQVPLFIATGDTIRLEVKSGDYLERAH